MARAAKAKPARKQVKKTAARPGLIDVHNHIIPPFYLEENRERIAGARGGQISPAWLGWSPEDALAQMDKHNVATSVLSLSQPGVWFGNLEEARSTARRCNEYATGMSRQHPGRFGVFAAIPLPDAEGSLREIEYAYDVLKADGIGLLTSYDDKWLGDAMYEPVMEELNRRKAVVFVHPTTPICCRTMMPGVATVIAEVPHDTARAILSLLYTGTLPKYRNVRFIWSHAGGTMPMLAGRFSNYAPKDMAKKIPKGVEYELRRFYYDVAVSGYRPAIDALKRLVPMSQILFGSDHPYRPLVESVVGMKHLGLTARELKAVGRDNVLALLPRLAAERR